MADFTKNTALILIDVQQGFRDLDYWGARNNPVALENMAAVLAHWRNCGRPVVHVHHDSIHRASPLNVSHIGNAFEPAVTPIAGEASYGKSVNSAFIGTSLEADLRERGISALVLCGITTDHCVNTTARMAGNLGFEVSVIGDACFTFDRVMPDGIVIAAQTVHDVHLASLSGEFAAICNTSDVVADLLA